MSNDIPVILTNDQIGLICHALAQMDRLVSGVNWDTYESLAMRKILDAAKERAAIRQDEREAYDNAPWHICDLCGTECRTKQGHERMWCPNCDKY